MKRYLAFAGDHEVKTNLGDFAGDFDELVMAKHAVQVRDPEGWPKFDQGCVLDTKLGKIHEWNSDATNLGRDEWKFARDLV